MILNLKRMRTRSVQSFSYLSSAVGRLALSALRSTCSERAECEDEQIDGDHCKSDIERSLKGSFIHVVQKPCSQHGATIARDQHCADNGGPFSVSEPKKAENRYFEPMLEDHAGGVGCDDVEAPERAGAEHGRSDGTRGAEKHGEKAANNARRKECLKTRRKALWPWAPNGIEDEKSNPCAQRPCRQFDSQPALQGRRR